MRRSILFLTVASVVVGCASGASPSITTSGATKNATTAATTSILSPVIESVAPTVPTTQTPTTLSRSTAPSAVASTTTAPSDSQWALVGSLDSLPAQFSVLNATTLAGAHIVVGYSADDGKGRVAFESRDLESWSRVPSIELGADLSVLRTDASPFGEALVGVVGDAEYTPHWISSSDGGLTWQTGPLDATDPGENVQIVQTSATGRTAENLWALGIQRTDDGLADVILWRSANGTRWTRTTVDSGVSGGSPTDLVSVNGQTVVGGAFAGVEDGFPRAAVWLVGDDGSSRRVELPVTAEEPSFVYGLINVDGRLLATGAENRQAVSWQSLDGGATWTPSTKMVAALETDVTVGQFAIPPRTPHSRYAVSALGQIVVTYIRRGDASDDALVVSRDRGTTWQEIPLAGLETRVQDLYFDTEDHLVLVTQAEGGSPVQLFRGSLD